MSWPIYASFWLSSLPVIYASGGLFSPVLGLYLVAFFYLGLRVQGPGLPADRLVAFTVLNLCFWTLVQFSGPSHHEYRLAGTVVAGVVFVLVFSSFFAIYDQFRTTKLLKKENQTFKASLNEMQGELAHSARMAQLGNFVATAAHELRQPMQVIASASELIRKLIQEGKTEKSLQLAERISDASTRIIRLSEYLREFSRKESFNPEPIDLRNEIHTLLSLTPYSLKYLKIKFDVQLSEEPLWVFGDSLQIQQVLLNLVNNARDACEKEKQATITIRAFGFKHWNRISITNPGPGISLCDQSKIFQSYFTTKQKGEGTGIGLVICDRIIEQHEGRIFYTSSPGETTFVVDLAKISIRQAQIAGA